MKEKRKALRRIPKVEGDPATVFLLQKGAKTARVAYTLSPPAGEQQAIDHSQGAAKFAKRPSALEVIAKAVKVARLIHKRPPQEIAESPMEGVVSLVNVTMESSHPRAAIHVYE